jgi:hypothetical protein
MDVKSHDVQVRMCKGLPKDTFCNSGFVIAMTEAAEIKDVSTLQVCVCGYVCMSVGVCVCVCFDVCMYLSVYMCISVCVYMCTSWCSSDEPIIHLYIYRHLSFLVSRRSIIIDMLDKLNAQTNTRMNSRPELI